MVNVVFNIGTEARLLHTCKVYGSTLPCFREKILECGDDRQRRVLNEVGKMLMFLCSPFSLYRQRQLIQHQECVRSVLSLPATTGCEVHETPYQLQLGSCRRLCQQQPTNFICLMKTWISEQNVCTLNDVEQKCGEEAAVFYRDLQNTVFDPAFPVLCEIEPEEVIMETTTTTTTTQSPTTTTSYLIVQTAKTDPKKAMLLKKRVKKPAFTNRIANATNIVFGVAPAPRSIDIPSFSPPITTTKEPTTYFEPIYSNPTELPMISPASADSANGSPSLLVWTKPNNRKQELNAEPAITEEATTSRSVKVITLLKSWLPAKLPGGLESFFQFGGDPTKTSSETTTTTTTTFSPLLLPTISYRNSNKQFAPIRRWRPWYMAGGENWDRD
ncbi:unnamed protein product, partial [Mesorhabditis belari]|uniref:Uncharacterized protein n=1 Tax=Mesorhabditis belari TaxID=2138241 RepID=A0AAF3EHG3_9BILA